MPARPPDDRSRRGGAARWLGRRIPLTCSAVLTQPLHGLTFALLHLACMRLLAENVPQQLAATAQAIYGTSASGWRLSVKLISVALTVFGTYGLFDYERSLLWRIPVAAGLEARQCHSSIAIDMRDQDRRYRRRLRFAGMGTHSLA